MSATNKKCSGAYYRKQKLKAEIADTKNSVAMRSWLTKSNAPAEPPDTDAEVCVVDTISLENENIETDNAPSTIPLSTHDHLPLRHYLPDQTSAARDGMPVDSSGDNSGTIDNEQFDFGDPGTWPNISNNLRSLLVEHGPTQHSNIDSTSSEVNGRRFSADWFMKTLPNKKIIRRTWLLYSPSKKTVFCFPCLLFGNSKSIMADISKGFNDWRHLHPRIPDHETSQEHTSNYLIWKQLEERLKKGKCIDNHLQDAINSEKAKWRHILKAISHAILFCATNNLALRGTQERIGKPQAGVFLNLIELLCNFDELLAQHVAQLEKGSLSYLSPTIQNEFIEVLASRVRGQIIDKIKNAQYYTILFDGTPDISRQEQMSQVIRYVEVSEGHCYVRESFVDFVNTSQKTGEGLASEIIEKIKMDGINISDMRGQGYDNGANMAGKYNGVQAHILRQNPLATFVPCSAHSLNLIGVHAASVTVQMGSFFGTVQSLYCFFSSSTGRWQLLMSFLKVTLKGHSQTRWSSKSRAISALKSQLPSLVNALKEIRADTKYGDAISAADGLLKQILCYDFVATLIFWNEILCSIDRVNIALQKKGLTIDYAAHFLNGLKKTVMDLRDDDNFKILFEEVHQITDSIGVENCFRETRIRKRRQLDSDESGEREGMIKPCDKFKFMCYEVIDSIVAQLQWRYDSLSTVLADFQFLFGTSLQSLSKSELRKHATDFAIKYSRDVDGHQLCAEIDTFKFQVAEIVPNLKTATPLELLEILHEIGLCESFPNIEIALRIFLTLPVTSASCERSFSKLKLIKNYLRSSIGQERLSGLAILSIEQELARSIDFDDILEKFAALKARKVKL